MSVTHILPGFKLGNSYDFPYIEQFSTNVVSLGPLVLSSVSDKFAYYVIAFSFDDMTGRYRPIYAKKTKREPNALIAG